jgi:hypothetical protein
MILDGEYNVNELEKTLPVVLLLVNNCDFIKKIESARNTHSGNWLTDVTLAQTNVELAMEMLEHDLETTPDFVHVLCSANSNDFVTRVEKPVTKTLPILAGSSLTTVLAAD